MIKHIVIINFNKDVSKDYLIIMEDTRKYIDQIPGITSYKIMANESQYTAQDVTSVGVEIIFQDQAAFNVFMEHPKHQEANKTFEKYLADPPFSVLTHNVPD